MTSSINTNISAYYAQANIAKASSAATTSVSRLSSGNFITKASDDVARLSIGTSFATTVRTLRQALVNAAQGVSLLQVADGALGQITEILQRQKTLAVQASSGNLSATDRGFLNQEFQALSQQIDFITSTTKFNGVSLIDGSLSTSSRIEDATKQAAAAVATIGLSANLADGDAITINGLVFTAKNTVANNQQFQIGATAADTARNLAEKLTSLTTSNAATITDATTTFAQKLGANTYTVDNGGTTLTIAARSGGALGNRFTIDASAITSGAVSVSGQYGSSTVSLFATNVSAFTSATNTVTAAVGAQTDTTPFAVGDDLQIQLGTGAKTTLYSFQAGDSLTDIVNGINGNSATSGVSATLIGDSTNGYNIRLNLSRSTGGDVALFGGENFYKVAATGVQNTTLSGSTSTTRLLSSSLASHIASTSATVVGTSATAPFANGSKIFASVNGGNYIDISGALGSSDGLDDIVAKINASEGAGSLGIVASLVGGNNIAIKYSDPTQSGSISFYTGTGSGGAAVPNTSTIYNTDATGKNRTNGLGGSFVSFNLLSTGVAAPDASLTGSTSTLATPFLTAGTSDIVITINDSATTSKEFTIDNITSGWTLQDLANAINNSNTNLSGGAAGTEDYGIHASIVVDSQGKYNLQLSYAASALPPAGTSGATASSGIRISYVNASALTTVNTTGTLHNDNDSTAYSTVNLFSASIAGNPTGTSALVTSGATSTTLPIKAGEDYTISVNGATITIDGDDLTNNLSVNDFLALINENTSAIAAGVTASLVNAGTSSANIELRIADTAGTGLRATALTTTQASDTSGQTSAATTYYANGENTNTTYRMFTTEFANAMHATGSVTHATTAAEGTPFVAGDTLSVRYNNGGGITNLTISSALAAGDTLADIVTKINSLTGTTGLSATLDTNGANILIKNNGAVITSTTAATGTNSPIYFNGGANFYVPLSTDSAAMVAMTGNGFNNSYTSVELFTSDVTSDTNGSIVHATTGDANEPLVNGNLVIQFTANNATRTATIAITTGMTMDEVADAINQNATIRQYGAEATRTGDSGTTNAVGNITLTFADTDLTGAAPATFTIANTDSHTTLNTATASDTFTTRDAILSYANTYAATISSSTGVTSNNVIGLNGGSDNGIGYGSTSVTGSVSNAILTGLAQKSAQVTIGFPDTDAAALSDAFSGKTVTVAGATFTFVSTASSPLEIAIGNSLQETIDNAVSTINKYGKETAIGDTAYQLNQINVSRNGNNLVFTGKGINNVTKLDGTAVSDIATTVANVSGPTNSGDLNNATRSGTGTFGVDVSGVTNASFTGKVSGFAAEYVGSNTVNLSIKVGNNTYTASSVNTKPTVGATGSDSLGNQIVRFYSDTYEDVNGKEIGGGYFDVQLAVNQGDTVTSQSQADSFAVRFNSAFQGLSFNQTRVISSYSGQSAIINASGTTTGSLVGTSVSAQLPTFEANKLTNISVTAPSAGSVDAKITFTIDGVQYTSSSFGSKLGANQTFKLSSVTDPNYFVTFTTGNVAIDVSTAENAKALEAALNVAFGTDAGSAALSFQIGTSSADALGVNIGAATTDALFEGKSLSITSIANATEASDAIDAALQSITSIRASVGALQSRFNFASANIQISVQNQDASRSELLDTDIAAESTSYATAQVQLQAGISVLAQANQQLQALLKLLG